MKKISFSGNTNGGKLTIYKKQEFIDFIYNTPDKDVIISVEEKKKKRSNNQNSYLWAVVYPIARNCFKEIGYFLTLEEVHEFFKDKFLKEIVTHPETGEVLGNKVKSTTELETFEFNEYFENIIIFVADTFSAEIPYPNEQVSLGF